MLWWLCGVTRTEETTSERMRGTTRAVETLKRVQAKGVQWYEREDMPVEE